MRSNGRDFVTQAERDRQVAENEAARQERLAAQAQAEKERVARQAATEAAMEAELRATLRVRYAALSDEDFDRLYDGIRLDYLKARAEAAYAAKRAQYGL